MSDILSVQAIAEELQKAYGDATPVEVDLEVARSIVKRLRSEGWASPEDVRVLIASAGGRIEIDEHAVIEPPQEIRTYDDPATMTRVVEVR